MADMPWEHADEARAALSAIVTDPEHGVTALSSPRTMSNLLKDLLPDAPREKNLLVAAAEAGLADTLREHVAQGMDSTTAIRLTASSFSQRTPLSPDACSWVTSEIAVALGISDSSEPSGPGGSQAGFPGTGQVPTEITPVQAGRSPGGASYLADPAHSGPEPSGFPAYSPENYAPTNAPGTPAGYSPDPPPPYSPGTPQAYSPGTPQAYSPGTPQAYSPGAPDAYSPGTPQAYSPGAPAAYSPGGQAGYAPGPMAGYGSSPGQGYPAGQQPAPAPAYQPMPSASQGKTSNTLAVVAFVLSLAQFIGWVILLVPGLIAAILAIVFGFVAMKQITRSGETGRGLAVTAVVLGFLGIVVVSILLAVGVAAIHNN